MPVCSRLDPNHSTHSIPHAHIVWGLAEPLYSQRLSRACRSCVPGAAEGAYFSTFV